MNKWIKFSHRDSRIQEDIHGGPLIKLENLVKIYDTGAVKVLGFKKINLTIEKGEFVAIMGYSGSGKSALMNIPRRLDRPTPGHYYLNGIDTADTRPDQFSDIRNQEIGFVFQSFDLIFRILTLKSVELPMTYVRVPKAKRAVRTQLLLERVGLGAKKEHISDGLSDGQRQRVAVVRALANESSLILADEPTRNLDTASLMEIMELFTKLHQEGATMVLVIHEEGIAAFVHCVIWFSDEQIQGDKLNVVRVVSGNGKGGEQNADREYEDGIFSHPTQ